MEKAVITIQRYFRGYLIRRNRLPTFLYIIQKYLGKKLSKKLSKKSTKKQSENTDGRINSIFDEEQISALLLKKFKQRIRIEKVRHWFDIRIKDYRYGWLPVNIKSTTTETRDNTGNLAMLVYSLINSNLHLDKSYSNGEMSKILMESLIDRKYSHNSKKDYYFLVLNKKKFNVIINSLKGLSVIHANNNNLPFQIKWKDNQEFKYTKITIIIRNLITILCKPKLTWKEEFLFNIRKLNSLSIGSVQF